MPRESLALLLENVTDEELESLRDAILREEGRRRAGFQLTIPAPFPPLKHDEQGESTVERWAKLITWLAKDSGFPPAVGKRGIHIRLTCGDQAPDSKEATILLQEAMVEAGLLVGRTPEWMDATATEVEQGAADSVLIEMWEKPVPHGWA
jgi:hypothetical protein